MHNVGFLIGAGLSQAMGLPGTRNITEILLNKNDYFQSQNDNTLWFKQANNPNQFDETGVLLKEKILLFLNDLSRLLRNYCRREIHYEELYYYLQQVKDTAIAMGYDGLTLYDNPFCQPYVLEAQRTLEPLFKHIDPDVPDTINSVFHIAEKAIEYVQEVVWRELSPIKVDAQDSANIYQFISDCHSDKDVPGLNIFCLNHDTLIETYLGKMKIAFVDGFIPVGKHCVWDGAHFISAPSNCRLSKLHGSVDWARQSTDSTESSYQDHSRECICKLSPNTNSGLPPNRLILIGTLNKVIDYSSYHSIFTDIFLDFVQQLKKTQTIISIGYSFNDLGINSQLISWMYSDPEYKHKIIIIDRKNEDQFVKSAMPPIRHAWQNQKEKGCLQYLARDCKATPISWGDLKKAIK
jgi:SIR2-like domain